MTTAKIFEAIEKAGWQVGSCPILYILDKECRDVIVQQSSECGYSAFRVKLDNKGEVIYFEALKIGTWRRGEVRGA